MRDAFARPPRREASRAYSLFVSTAKFALPAVAIAIIGVIALWPSIESATRAPVGFAKLNIENLEGSPMLDAFFQSTDEDDRPFRVAADAATPSQAGPDLVELDRPSGAMRLDDGGQLFISADAGLFDRAAQRLELFGAVWLSSEDGHGLRTEMAMIDLKAGFAQGLTPVAGDGPSGAIASRGFQVVDGGAIVVFTGPARAVLASARAASAP